MTKFDVINIKSSFNFLLLLIIVIYQITKFLYYNKKLNSNFIKMKY